MRPHNSALILSFLLLFGASSVRAFEVFQDPTDTGTNPGAPLEVSDPNTKLNLFIHQDGVAADPNLACSGTPGAGDELCAWDLRIVSTGITLDDFVPEPGLCAGGSNDGLPCLVTPDCPGGSCPDIVHNCELGCGGELRANGGDPLLGQVGTYRIGTLTVSPGAGAVGSVDVTGNLFVTAALETEPVPFNPLATRGVCPDFDGDDVCDDVDNCTEVFNPRVASPPAWMTLTGGQRDDDGDGYGNICDGKFDTAGTNVGPPDVLEFVASLGKNRESSSCGTSGSDNCARYDLDEATATNIGPPDVAIFIGLLGGLPGPRCAGCPLP